MKATLHPQLIAVIGISAAILLLHSRGFAGSPISSAPTAAMRIPNIVTLATIPKVIPRRDPFTANVDETAPQERQPNFDGMLAAIPQKNEGAIKSDAHDGLHLRAVVLGSKRYALVAEGSASQIVTIGSPLAGSTVSDISLRGITLANGARFIPEEGAK